MYKTFVPKFLRRGRRRGGDDDDDDDMFTCRNPAQLPSSSDYSSTIRASSAIIIMQPPPSTATTYVNSPRALSHQGSTFSMRSKPEPAALLSTIPDEADDFAEVDPRFPRRSQIGMALSKLPTPPDRNDGDIYGSSSRRKQDSGPYSPTTPIYPAASSIRSHSRNGSLPSPRTPHSRHHSFSRPASRSVDHGFPRPPMHSSTAAAAATTSDLSRGRSRSRSRSRTRSGGGGGGGGALSRDASHDSSSSRVPISRFNNLAGGRGGMPGDAGDDGSGSGSAGVSMTTIWSDAPRRGSKHSRI